MDSGERALFDAPLPEPLEARAVGAATAQRPDVEGRGAKTGDQGRVVEFRIVG